MNSEATIRLELKLDLILVITQIDESETEQQPCHRKTVIGTSSGIQERVECKAALLGFHGDAVRWYHLLREGKMYRLTCCDDEKQVMEDLQCFFFRI